MKVKLGIGFGTKDKQDDRQLTKKAHHTPPPPQPPHTPSHR